MKPVFFRVFEIQPCEASVKSVMVLLLQQWTQKSNMSSLWAFHKNQKRNL